MAPIDLKNIQWEDEEESSVKKNQCDEFAAMFASETFEDDHFPAGSQVEGTVAQIPQDSNDVIIELSRRHNGLIDKNELLDEQGELRVKEGDRIPLYVISSRGGEIQLSTSLSASRRAADDLYGAFRSALPVKGKVIKENSGGFDVMVLGKRAFCPVSQIDNHYVLNKGEYVNKEYNFLIEKIEEGGRNIVVSRAKLLARDAALKIEELKGRLKEDIILEGTVTDVRDFGAFVDLGGFQGFVHVSEMSFSRVSKATEFTHRGEKVRVKVLSIEEKDGKTRISCSMKAAQNDPWGDIASRLSVGASYQGEVKRLEKFGAFVEIEPGVEGLIHISEMSWQKRIHHPSDVVKAGDWVEVKVLDIDPTSRRISLSLKDAAGDPWQSVSDQFKPGALVTGKVVSLKGFGAIVEVAEGVTGLVPITALKSAYGESYRKKCSPPQTVELKVLEVRQAERQMLLAPPEAAQMDQVEQDYREYVQQQKEQKEKTAPTKGQGTFGALLAAKLRDKN